MGWLMSALGTALAVAGTIAIASGAPYIQVEWGYSEVIAGTTALSAGIVTVALAAILFALRGMTRKVLAGVAAQAIPIGNAVSDADLGSNAPRPAGRLRTKLSTLGQPKDRLAGSDIGRVEPAPMPPAPEADAWAARHAIEAPADFAPQPGPRPDQEPALFRPAQDAAPSEAPTVVGRYDANGAFYVLFSDGTIEVETDAGTHRYASMQDLRDHIERQEPG